MQSGDDRLAKLAEKLHGVRDNLPGANEAAPSVPPSDIRVKRNSGNINFGTQVNIGSSLSPEPMAQPQRRSLNDRVEAIAGGYGVDPRAVWREVLHTRFGVNSVSELSKTQFVEASQALDAYEAQLKGHLAESKEQNHVKRLVAEALQIANDRDVYPAMSRFCSREFGETVLNNLSPDQLKLVLKFLEGAAAAQEASAKSVEPEQRAPTASSLPSAFARGAFFAEAKAFAFQYPMHCGAIALVLMILGKIV